MRDGRLGSTNFRKADSALTSSPFAAPALSRTTANARVALAYTCAAVLCAFLVYAVLDLSRTGAPSADGERSGFFHHALFPYQNR